MIGAIIGTHQEASPEPGDGYRRSLMLSLNRIGLFGPGKAANADGLPTELQKRTILTHCGSFLW